MLNITNLFRNNKILSLISKFQSISYITTHKITYIPKKTAFLFLNILLTMHCGVVYNVFFWNFLLMELIPTDSTKPMRIIGGRDADETKYQYVVRLQFQIFFSERDKIEILKTLHSCTAAVLTPTWALTAAHCFNTQILELELESQDISLRPVVSYGPHNITTFSLVMDIIKHPAYKLRTYELLNDVALMRHEPITLNQYARLSGLDYVTMFGQEVTLTGYGITSGTSISDNTLVHVNHATALGKPLQLSDVVVVQCSVTNYLLLKPRMCLARRCDKLSGVCLGDSGGPVLHDSGVVGINSVGTQQVKKFCTLKAFVTFYDPAEITPTSPYIDWISSIIRNEVPKHYNRYEKVK